MTRDSLDWDQLGRYVAGESSAEESAAVRRWLDEHPSDAEVIAALQQATDRVVPEREVDVERALRRVKARREAARPITRRFATLAAAAVLMLAVGVFAWDRARDGSAIGRTFETAAGMQDTIRLDDGSTVVLGAGSRLVVRERQADLEGEAYFDVVHDERQPFTVRSGDVVIRDVGTQFSVLGVPSEPVRVVVTEGVVQLERDGQSVTLERGDVGVARSGGIEAGRGEAHADDIAWMQGRLVFRDAPLSRVTSDLRRWYGVELRMTDTALLQRHFTGSFVNESGDRVVDIIALALGARVQRRGDTAFVGGIAAPR